MQKITRAYGALKLALDAKSPTLLVVGGVAAMGVSVVLACRQTIVCQDVVKPLVERIERVEPKNEAEQTEKKAIQIALIQTTVRCYAVPAVVFVSGAVMVFRGHHKLQQRNAALALAFTTIKKSFDAYRARVIQMQGHEADQTFMHGSKSISAMVDGKPTIVNTRDWETSKQDPYNRVFSQDNSNQWQNDLGCNKDFVHGQQRFAQQILNRQGYLYLSDVYRSLGFAESDISRVVGWKIAILPDGSRDVPVVDFGLDTMLPDDWKYNSKREIYLDFNCQGLIVGGKVQKMLEDA